MSREQNIQERNSLLNSLMSDPEFAEAIEAINSLADTNIKKPRTKRKKHDSDRPFKSKANIPTERRQSSRLKKQPPQYSQEDLIDDKIVRLVEKKRPQFSEGYLKMISERQTNFWKNYWQKKREEKAKLAVSQDKTEPQLKRNKIAGTKNKKAAAASKSSKSKPKLSRKEYLKQLSERRTQYWKEYWQKKRQSSQLNKNESPEEDSMVENVEDND